MIYNLQHQDKKKVRKLNQEVFFTLSTTKKLLMNGLPKYRIYVGHQGFFIVENDTLKLLKILK